MKNLLCFIILVCTYSNSYCQVDTNYKNIPFSLIYPQKSFYLDFSNDTIFAVTYKNKQKLILVYTKYEKNSWATFYSNGQIKEFGEFKKYYKWIGDRTSRNRTMVKTGIWNYYNKHGTLVKVIDHKKGSLDSD